MTDALSQAAVAYKAALPEGDFAEFPIEAADPFAPGVHLMRTGLSRDGGPFVCGMGYGMSALEASVSARGELVEMILLREAAKGWDVERGTFEEMQARRGDVIDPYSLVLPVGCEDMERRSFAWTTVKRLPDGKTFWAPIEFVASSSGALPEGYDPLTPPISNGNGAGDTEARAVVHALLELLQRDGNAASFRALDQGRVWVDPPLDENSQAMRRALASRGLDILFKVADHSLGIPSVYAIPVLDGEDEPLAMTACGEAADPDPAKAARKAMLEALAARARKLFSHGPESLSTALEPEDVSQRAAAIDPSSEEPAALSSCLELLELGPSDVRVRMAGNVLGRKEDVATSQLQKGTLADEPEARLAALLQRLEGEGLTAYAKTVSNGPATAAKVIVPGIEMELCSFHRLGLRGAKRLLERGDPLLLREPRQGAARLTLRPEQEEALGGPAWLDLAALRRTVAPLYFLYREPTPGAVRSHLRRQRAA